MKMTRWGDGVMGQFFYSQGLGLGLSHKFVY